MKKIFKAIIGAIMFLLGSDCDTRRESVDEKLCDFSGQGKDRYGK